MALICSPVFPVTPDIMAQLTVSDHLQLSSAQEARQSHVSISSKATQLAVGHGRIKEAENEDKAIIRKLGTTV